LAFFSPFWPFQPAFTFGLFGLNLGAVFIFKPFILLISALALSAVFGSSEPLLAFGLFGLSLSLSIGIFGFFQPLLASSASFQPLAFLVSASALSSLAALSLYWPFLAILQPSQTFQYLFSPLSGLFQPFQKLVSLI
jgi:hypothetical protein